MVTQGTVDEDIYQMQQRKAQMNAAILETGSEDGFSSSSSNTGATNKKSGDRKEITNMVQSAVDRFILQSPEAKATKPNEDEKLLPETMASAKPSVDEEQKPGPQRARPKDGHHVLPSETENDGNARTDEAEVIEIE
jgi:hypothetical protein